MRPITANPPNTGVSLASLDGHSLSQREMYLRCNFELPSSPPNGFELVAPGNSRRFITPEDLHEFERVEQEIVLECAGNGRTFMSPVPDGTPWDLDGVSPITAGGYRLADLLGGLTEEVFEVVFTGADTGTVEPEGRVPYQFSISRDAALSSRPLLVTHIGGEPLDLAHGAPVRLIVPGHYAMKSVKWLVRVEAVAAPFEGHFVRKYRYYGDEREPEQAPVGELAVRSVIATPGDGDMVAAGEMTISGSAWSGSSPIASVEVSVDGGESWIEADLRTRPDSPWSAVPWEVVVDAGTGSVAVVARATDRSGATQPLEPRWNANGYANNVVHRVTVTVE